jgi:transposase
MDVVNPLCAGLDVHKQTVVACRIYPDATGKLVKEVATFETMTDSLVALRDWLTAARIPIVAMESTGVYWKPVYTILVEAVEILVVNAAHMKTIPGHKTDVKDAEWIADLLRHGLLKGSFIPSEEQRDVRELTRLRSSVVAERSRAVNRLQKLLEQANLKLVSVVSDVTGVSARAMLDNLVAGRTDAKLLAALAQGRLKDKTDLLERALDGRVRAVHRFLLRLHLEHIDDLNAKLVELEEEIGKHIPLLTTITCWNAYKPSLGLVLKWRNLWLLKSVLI